MPVPQKSRLGRGLGSLIAHATPPAAPKAAHAGAATPAVAATPSPKAKADAPESAPGFQEIGVHLIEPSPYQARREFPAEQLAELTESIRAEGLLQPVVVRRQGDKFQLIAGERRWRAFQQLSLKTIPARVVEASNASAATIGLIENLQREGLNPLEEAQGYASLIRDFDLTQEIAAGRVGKSRAAVANTLRLLSLDAELQGYLGKNLLSVGHAKVLLGVPDAAHRAMLARRVIEGGLSVRAAEQLVAARTRGGSGPRRALAPADTAAVADVEKKLTAHLGARVALQHTPKKGKIIIEYRGNEDLERLMEKMGIGP